MALFGSIFNESMSWMRGRYFVAILFGVIGAPLSYLAGARFGAIRVNEDTWSWVGLVALTWGAAMPILIGLQQRWTPSPSKH